MTEHENEQQRRHATIGTVSRRWCTPLLALLLLAAATSACGRAEHPRAVVTGHLALHDRVSRVITQDTIRAIRGTYGAACVDRAGSWTLALPGYSRPVGEATLSVVLGNTLCTLSITEVRAGPAAAPRSYQPPGPFLMGAAFASEGLAFKLDGAGAVAFYANFLVGPDLAFSSNFLVQMVYSDDVSLTDLAANTHYEVLVSTATIGSISAPDGLLSVVPLVIGLSADNHVIHADGSITLVQGDLVGAAYVIDLDTLGAAPSYAAIDARYRALPQVPLVGVVGSSQDIPAVDLGLAGLDLTTPAWRNVIVARVVSGLKAYQLFRITFRSPLSTVDTTPPLGLSSAPADTATGVATGSAITATFGESLEPLSVTAASFTLTLGGAPVTGVVSVSGATATFIPDAPLTASTSYVATVTTAVTDLAGNHLASAWTWTFTTGSTAVPARVALGAAGDFAVFSKTAVTADPTARIIGDVGLALDSSAFIGFTQLVDASGDFSTSALVTGHLYAHDYTGTTPATLDAAVSALDAGYTEGFGRSPVDVTYAGGGDLIGLTLLPGVYRWSGAASVTDDVTLSGGPNDVWILQVDGALSLTAGARVLLTGGALPRNVFWLTSGAVTLGAGAHLAGVVLSATTASTGDGATVTGRLLVQTAATLGVNSIVTQPAP